MFFENVSPELRHEMESITRQVFRDIEYAEKHIQSATNDLDKDHAEAELALAKAKLRLIATSELEYETRIANKR